MEDDCFNFFHSPSSSRAVEQREQTPWANYLTTLKKPTAVTLSCCGKFSGQNELNLVICKGTLVSIYVVTGNTLKHLREFPVFGMVIFMELSHVHHLGKYILFIATETGKLCIFEWDTEASNVVSLDTKQFILPMVELDENSYNDLWKGGTVNFKGTIIVVYSRRDHLWVVDVANLGVGNPRFTKRMLSAKILDVKFLKTLSTHCPRLALLYKGVDGNLHSGIYEISTEDDIVPKRVILHDTAFEPRFLIPNDYSFLVIGKQDVVYIRENQTKTKFMGHLDIQAYGTVKESLGRCIYLLGGHDGHLLLLEVKTSINERPLGKTSRASSITYLCDDLAFVGSRVADSQLLKMHQLHEPSLGTGLELVMAFNNSGPVIDFSVSNQPGGRRKLVMSCGTREDCCLERIVTGVGVDEKLFIKALQVERIWSLKSSTSDDYHTFLILQGLSEKSLATKKTLAVKIDNTGGIVTHMEGLVSDLVTIVCHEAVNGAFTQVTEESVRLIDCTSGYLRNEWCSRVEIFFASATATQVLLSNSDEQLVYLKLSNGQFVEEKVVNGYAVACLDISTVGANRFNRLADPPKSKFAAVGLWTEHTIQVLSLPNLEVLAVTNCTSVPRCILLCEFEKLPYLLCAEENGSVSTFELNMDNGELGRKETKELGDLGRTLHTFSTNGVFYSTEKAPKLIFTKKQKLQYNKLNLTNIKDMCPFQRADSPEGIAIVTEEGVSICTMGDREHYSKIPMVGYVRRVCHQEETESYAILVEEKNGRHIVQLMDKELKTISSFSLLEKEIGLSIVSCSFTGDVKRYYCVGTAFEDKGRLLVFKVKHGELKPVSLSNYTKTVSYLTACHGGLLVVFGGPNAITRYFDWIRLTKKFRENPNLAGSAFDTAVVRERVYAQTSSEIQKYEVDDNNSDLDASERELFSTAMLLLENGTFFRADGLYNIYVSEKYEDVNFIGRCSSGQFITVMKPGTLSTLPDKDYAQAPSIMFSTASGAIQVIISFPEKVFDFLSRLHRSMWMKTMGKGYPDELNPYQFFDSIDELDQEQFLDGDFIESFPTLTLADQESIAKEMKYEVDILRRVAEYVNRFH